MFFPATSKATLLCSGTVYFGIYLLLGRTRNQWVSSGIKTRAETNIITCYSNILYINEQINDLEYMYKNE